MSDIVIHSNIYEEELNDETTLDLSSQNLESVPFISNKFLRMLYLQNNKITTLPEEFFPSLPNLMWLDLRDNCLTDLSKSIRNHPTLTHLLLQNNNLTSLPDELGTVLTLKVIQLNGNPLMYPPKEVINAGVIKMLSFLHDKYFKQILAPSTSDVSDVTSSSSIFPEAIFGQDIRSFNSVIDGEKNNLSIKFNEKEESDDEQQYSKRKGKCPKLGRCRINNHSFSQSAKYLKQLYADKKGIREEKIKQTYLKEIAIKKQKDLLAVREKVLQDRKNIELLQNWRRNYRYKQFANKNSTYRLEPRTFPYDTNPEYTTLLTREDIEKDLPDKYKKKLVRRSKPTVPRKNTSDVHLAMKIKELFENLESINLNGGVMTPRTEQKVLLNEIQKITEIKQKLHELSTTNVRSVVAD